MLPFLKKKQQAGIIVKERQPNGSIEHSMDKEESNEDQGLIAAAQDLINAINSKDAKAVSQALQAAFEICDALPHEEGEHINENDESYESQNEKAALNQEE